MVTFVEECQAYIDHVKENYRGYDSEKKFKGNSYLPISPFYDKNDKCTMNCPQETVRYRLAISKHMGLHNLY